jgi:AbrB family looped-hinge helix DNA binding protein
MKARVSSKGQLVLPKEIRDKRGIGPGTEVEIEEVPEGVLLRLVKGSKVVTLRDLVGCTGYRGPRKSLEEMAAAIQKGARAAR